MVPRTIAENSGLNATDAVAALYQAHASGQAAAGLDVETGELPGGRGCSEHGEEEERRGLRAQLCVAMSLRAACFVLQGDGRHTILHASQAKHAHHAMGQLCVQAAPRTWVRRACSTSTPPSGALQGWHHCIGSRPGTVVCARRLLRPPLHWLADRKPAADPRLTSLLLACFPPCRRRWALKLATEAAVTVLRIDQVRRVGSSFVDVFFWELDVEVQTCARIECVPMLEGTPCPPPFAWPRPVWCRSRALAHASGPTCQCGSLSSGGLQTHFHPASLCLPLRSSWPRWRAGPSRAPAAWTTRTRLAENLQKSEAPRAAWVAPPAIQLAHYGHLVHLGCKAPPSKGIWIEWRSAGAAHTWDTYRSMCRRRLQQSRCLRSARCTTCRLPKVCELLLVQAQALNPDRCGATWHRGGGGAVATCCAQRARHAHMSMVGAAKSLQPLLNYQQSCPA